MIVRVFRITFALLIFSSSFTFLLFPLLHSGWSLAFDPGLRSSAPNKLSFRMHASVSERIPDYVDERIASGKAQTLGPDQITATEWPVFGAFFYLLATENLQEQWTENPSLAAVSPAESGRSAIDASLRIMLDEGHAHWVRDYWGEDYMKDPNCFYRALYIGCISSHYQLTKDRMHLGLLRKVTEDFVDDFNRSPCGLLDDYPGQCYPADVVFAIAMIQRADRALGVDRGDWVKRTLHRVMANFEYELPPYTADVTTGMVQTPTRGCTNGFFFTFVGEIDPALAKELYQTYRESFWKENLLTHGWREFQSSDNEEEFYYDPDSGPVISEIGCAATGLGLGVARAYGDSEKGSALSTQLLATAIPLPGGRLLVPSLVADHEHAPLFPEIVMLHQLSMSSAESTTAVSMPPIVWLLWTLQGILSFVLIRWSWRLIQRGRSADA